MEETCCTLEQLALIGVDPETVMSAFLWGFGAYAFFWGLGFAARAAVKAIRQM